MHPILIEIWGFKLYAFGVMVALAYILGLWLMCARAKQAGEDVNDYLESAIWLMVAGIGGARLFYIFYYWQAFLENPMAILFSRGGLVWYGGMLGVVAAIVLYTRLKKIPTWRFLDILAPAAALGLAIGRIGCFLAGCCYGGPCNLPWAVHYPHDHPTFGISVHPAPLYESFAMFGVTLLLLRFDHQKPFAGATTWAFILLYGIIRFLIEYVRGDRLIWLHTLDLSASQVMSLVGILGSVLAFGLMHARKAKTHSAHPEPNRMPSQ